MGILTDYLVQRSNGLLKIVPEVSDNEKKGYLMFDSGATEIEVGEFLYGLIKLIKPEKVLTTGIYTGISDMFIAQALLENDKGKSIALEFEEYHINRARDLWIRTGVAQFITPIHIASLNYQPTDKFQFIFLDTEPGIRFAELEKFYPFLEDGGFIGIHDLPRSMCQGNINPDHPEMKSYPYGDIPPYMMGLLKTGELAKFHFSSPRGITFFYKRRSDDFKP